MKIKRDKSKNYQNFFFCDSCPLNYEERQQSLPHNYTFNRRIDDENITMIRNASNIFDYSFMHTFLWHYFRGHEQVTLRHLCCYFNFLSQQTHIPVLHLSLQEFHWSPTLRLSCFSHLVHHPLMGGPVIDYLLA